MTKPNSDKSNRAKRRRQEKEIERAQRGGARPPVAQQPSRGAQQGTPIDINALYQRIGVLTVERDYWAARTMEVSTIPQAPAVGDIMGQEAPAMQEAVAAATEEAEAAVDQEQDIDRDFEERAAADAEKFPELQNTDGGVLAEEGEDPDLQVTGAVEDDGPAIIDHAADTVQEQEPTETPA